MSPIKARGNLTQKGVTPSYVFQQYLRPYICFQIQLHAQHIQLSNKNSCIILHCCFDVSHAQQDYCCGKIFLLLPQYLHP